MARDFNAAASDYLVSATSTAPVLEEPCTLACLFYPDRNTAAEDLVSIVPDTGTVDGFRLRIRGDAAGDYINATSREASGENQATSNPNGISVGSWQHAAAVFAATNSRTAFLNGVAGTTDTTVKDVSMASTSKVSIGAYRTGATANPFDGRIAEVGIWNVALTAAEIAILAQGFSPALVRPVALVFHAQLIRDLTEIKRAATLTASGTAVIEHPRVIARKGGRAILVAAAGGGQTVTVNQATETDTAQAVTVNPIRRLVGRVTETDTAQAVAHVKTRAVGQVAETDLAQAVGHAKTVTLGQPSETDLAQTIAHGVTVSLGQPSETDLSQAIVWSTRRLVGQAAETDLAQPITMVGGAVGPISITIAEAAIGSALLAETGIGSAVASDALPS